jgi:hypothetical protein
MSKVHVLEGLRKEKEYCGLLQYDIEAANAQAQDMCVTNVTEPTNYMRLSKKIIHRADDLANLGPYNPVVREITKDFKPTYIPAKIIISSAVTITSYIKVCVTNTSEFKHSYYKPVSNESSGNILFKSHTQSSKYSASSGSYSNKSIR